MFTYIVNTLLIIYSLTHEKEMWVMWTIPYRIRNCTAMYLRNFH